ncbi:MAG: DUF1932 domain-containing protein [Egibacteraceae bacterium]
MAGTTIQQEENRMGVTIALLHPGAMGASVGAAAVAAGATVVWVGEGRSAATRARAGEVGLEDAGRLADALGAADAVLSVCPPHAATQVAEAVASEGFAGIYVDVNAVSPATAERVGDAVTAAGASYTDGGIVGPPAWQPGTTRLYLSGAQADAVAAWFAGGPLEAIPLSGGPTAASALKAAYAAWTKGSAALLLAVRALAGANGVEAALLDEWDRSLPELSGRSASTAARTAPKAWRFSGEMDEIADAFAAAGLPDGFHRAAAEVYGRLARFKGAGGVDAEQVLDALREPRP